MLSDMIKMALESDNKPLLKVVRENGFIWDPKELIIATTPTPILTINESGSFVAIENEDQEDDLCDYDKLYAKHIQEIVDKNLLPEKFLTAMKENLLIFDE